MKIGLYVPSWPAGRTANGIVTYASQLIPALRRMQHEVFVLTSLKTNGDDDPYTIDLRRILLTTTLWERTMFRFLPETAIFHSASSTLVIAIRELVEKHQLDIFEMEESYGSSFAISRLMLLPVVVRLHGPWFLNRSDEPNLKASRREKWECRGIQSANFVTAPSRKVLAAVKDHYRLDLSASRVIPNPLQASGETEAWNIKDCDADSILFVGRFDQLKGGDLVLRVFAKLAASYPKLKLTFVGPDVGIVQADGTILDFEHFVQENLPDRCRSRIEFCGQITHSEVMARRRTHFITIIASQNESFGYSVLEAMSVGCPLVATAVGGIPELIQDRRNGLLVATQDIDAMLIACKSLLDDPLLAERLGQQAWLDCYNLYRPDRIARETVAVYEKAIYTFNSE